MTPRQLTQVLTALAAVALAASLAPAQPKPEPVRAEIKRAVLDTAALRPGDKAMVAVEIEIKTGFHSQSTTPVDPNAIPFELKMDDHPAATFAVPVYPAGEEHEYPELG